MTVAAETIIGEVYVREYDQYSNAFDGWTFLTYVSPRQQWNNNNVGSGHWKGGQKVSGYWYTTLDAQWGLEGMLITYTGVTIGPYVFPATRSIFRIDW